MAKSIGSFNVSDLSRVLEGPDKGIPVDARNKPKYVAGKPTQDFESVTMDILTQKLGVISVVYPYREGLADELNRRYDFGQSVSLFDLGNLTDCKISIYNGSLSIKVMMEE